LSTPDRLSEEDRARIVGRYEERFRQYGDDLRTLNTGKGDKLRIQHTAHASIGDLENTTLLDIGCGLGYYYKFLRDQSIPIRYIGYDIVPSFIEANRQQFPEAEFEVRDISQDGIAHEADYVCMCQVFNNRYEDVDNDSVVRSALEAACKAERRGVSIDMLGDYVNYHEDHLFYFSPERMFSYAKSLTPFVSLRHDYLPFDFTLFLYKEATLV